jgi:NAD(P)-dependent dehydrogenase (short-subunit alcohol dehydrogenase family)
VPSPAELFDLTDRVALVTGGSRGLGREMALAFAASGADVVIASRKLDACTAVAAEVRETSGREALALACHLGHWDELNGLVDATYAKFGKIDVLVNNAGASPIYDDVVNVSEELFDKTIALNLKGPFRLTALVGRRMIDAGRGSIVNISSVGAVRPAPNMIPYAAAKAGLNALTLAFAQTFGPEVRVNAIMAGTFLTDISKAWDPDEFAKMARTFALQRGGEPPEIVGTALYLASDASTYTTGAIIPVDGGVP